MQTHIGHHILHSSLARHESESKDLLGTHDDGNFSIADPCGWYGLEGLCITQPVPKGKKVTVISNCDYHYMKMQYKASNFVSGKSICTNVPLHCYLCKQDGDRPLPTFWKYNFVHHMMKYHAGKNTLLPLEMVVETHISVEEGDTMGISAMSTRSFA